MDKAIRIAGVFMGVIFILIGLFNIFVLAGTCMGCPPRPVMNIIGIIFMVIGLIGIYLIVKVK
jgi:hypothetical protein